MRRSFGPDRRRRTPRLTAPLCLLGAVASCAGAGSDVHLAPLYTRANTADAAIEQEALGGLWRHRRRAADLKFEEVTVGPFYGLSKGDNDDWAANYLVPLGFASSRGDEQKSILFPIWIWGRYREEDDSFTWQLAALPGLLIENNEFRGTQFALFPFWAGFDEFVTFDKVVVLLWPLFIYAERAGRISYHVLWPFVGWTYGGGESSVKVWPFFSKAHWEGRYKRYYFLWPFFHYQRNHLGGGGEEPETLWMFWPFIGRTSRGSYVAWTFLWPFFGYSRDPRNDFWALDAPWLLVRFQRGPGIMRRSRVWPFYGYLRTDNLIARSYLWPLVHVRHEDRPDSVRDAFHIVPLWQSWNRRVKSTGETSAWRKLVPLFQYERQDTWVRASFPTLDPFWRNQVVDRYFAWMWKVYEWEEQAELRRERLWLGLYKRERGLGEDRRSIAGLWSSRKFEDGGLTVRETSLLFGLIRWRVTEGDGFAMLKPALPGPGWPAQGVRD